jgi:hypothetical protein
MPELSDTSTARLSVVKQATKDNIVPATPGWLNLPVTSIGLDEQLESSDSGVLRPDRQYSNARILTGSSGGDIPIELSYSGAFEMLLLGCLQSSSNSMVNLASAFNQSAKHYFTFEKFFQADDGGLYKWTKDAQINSMTVNFESNAFLSCSVNVLGLAVEGPASVPKVGSTYTDVDMANQFDTNSLEIVIKDSVGVAIETEVQSGSLEMSNNLRKQAAVGKFYGAGNASSRFSCMSKLNLYFINRKIYEGFRANSSFSIEMTFTAPDGAKYLAVMNNCKVTSYSDPVGGVDTDIMINVELRANADSSVPSRSITWTKTDAV